MFQYPGGKSHLSDKIIGLMPQHDCYVEGFGGSGAVILNKPKVTVNVYNDLDSDLVHFFTVFREEPEKLIKKVSKIPYSAEWYEEASPIFYADELPGGTLIGGKEFGDEINNDHITRAAVFFALRYMQWGAKYQGKSGFGRSKVQNGAETFSNAKNRLSEFMGFWDDVTIDNVSYEKLIDSYDSEDTVWYFDPPYIGTEEYYRESEFDHQKFCKHLSRIEGYWLVSYDEVPDELDGHYLIQEESTNFIDSGVKGEGKDTIESLILNYNPDDVQRFSKDGQMGFSQFSSKKKHEETKTEEILSGQALWGEQESEDEEDGGWLSNAI